MLLQLFWALTLIVSGSVYCQTKYQELAMARTDGKSFNTVNAESFNQRMFSFSGRLSRLAFLMRLLFVEIGGTVLTLVLVVIALFIINIIPIFGIVVGLIVMALAAITSIAMVVANYALTVRRLHDIGLSGCWIIVSFVCNIVVGRDYALQEGPIAQASTLGLLAFGVAIVFFLLLLLWPGVKGPNNYGPDPLQGGVISGTAKPGPGVLPERGRHPTDPLPPQRPSRIATAQNSPVAAPRSVETPTSVNKISSGGGRGTKLKVTRKN